MGVVFKLQSRHIPPQKFLDKNFFSRQNPPVVNQKRPSPEVLQGMPPNERCRKLVTEADIGLFSKFALLSRFNFPMSIAVGLRQEAQDAIRRSVLAIPAMPIPIHKDYDGILSTVFNSTLPSMDWHAVATGIRTTQSATAVFASPSTTVCHSQNNMVTALRREMWAEKAQFLARLLVERALLTMVAGEDANLYRRELLEVMDGIVGLVLKTPIYEADACPENGIPAYYVDKGPQAGIHFAKRTYNFNLMFHELGHRLQFSNTGVPRRFVSYSSNAERVVVPQNINIATEYLWIEEEVYQWNVSYVLFKAGYTDRERRDFEMALGQIRRLQEVGPIFSKDCDVLAGKAPQAYDAVLQLFKRIQEIPDFSKAEIQSAQALVTAYFNIDIDQDGLIRIKEGQLPWLLGQFYHNHLAAK